MMPRSPELCWDVGCWDVIVAGFGSPLYTRLWVLWGREECYPMHCGHAWVEVPAYAMQEW